ncbi:MAG TPA: holo-ACP synthase [Candidatus Brocadiia bacterium]|nr:holo-ACP synthase [Candidatus Brocadiia bacterium]
MIVGLGTDIVEIARIERLAARHGGRFLKRVFTERELAHCDALKNRGACLAARFAVKEATLKALGTGLRGQLRLTQIEAVNDDVGKPGLILTGEAERMAMELCVVKTHVAISHEREYAVAVVLLENA